MFNQFIFVLNKIFYYINMSRRDISKLLLDEQGIVSERNSTYVALGIGAKFTGLREKVPHYASYSIMITADQVSTLKIFLSNDYTNAQKTITKTISVSTPLCLTNSISSEFLWIEVENTSGIAQTSLNCQTIYHKYSTKLNLGNATDTIDDNTQVVNTRSITVVEKSDGTFENLEQIKTEDTIDLTTELVKTRSVLVAKKADGNYQNLNSDYNGDLRVALGKSNLTAFGDISISTITPIIQEIFTYNLNDRRWSISTTGSALIPFLTTNSMASISTGTTTGSTAILQTKKHIKYRPGEGILSRFTCLYTLGVAGTKQYSGLGNIGDGFFFGYNGAVFGILHKNKASGVPVETFIPQTTWNRDKADGVTTLPLLDWTKGQVFQIQLQFLGFGSINFYIENPNSGSFVLIHVIDYAGMNINPSLADPSLQICFEADNGATTTDIVMKSASVSGFIEGKSPTQGLSWSYDFSKSGIGSTLTNVLTVRNKSIYAGKPNNDILSPLFLNVSTIGANKPVYIALIKNTTLGGTPVWNDINTNNSFAEVDVAGTTVTNGFIIFSFIMGKEDTRIINITDLKEFIEHDETFTIAGSVPTSTVEIFTSFNWVEN
jgi:hypothetical protein